MASKTDEMFPERMIAKMPDSVGCGCRAVGPKELGAGLVLSCCPTFWITQLETKLFHVTCDPPPPTPRTLPSLREGSHKCVALDSWRHHRVSCVKAGFVGKRGNVAARICRERGVQVTTNVLVRDLEPVVVDGLPQFGGAQLAVDTTVCDLRIDGRPTTRAAVGSPERRGAKRQRTQNKQTRQGFEVMVSITETQSFMSHWRKVDHRGYQLHTMWIGTTACGEAAK